MSFFLEDPSEEPAALLRQLGNLESSASAKRAIRTQLQRELEDVEAQLQLLSAPSAPPGRARAGTSPSRQRFDRNAALFSPTATGSGHRHRERSRQQQRAAGEASPSASPSSSLSPLRARTRAAGAARPATTAAAGGGTPGSSRALPLVNASPPPSESASDSGASAGAGTGAGAGAGSRDALPNVWTPETRSRPPKAARSNSVVALEALGLGHGTVAGYAVERGVDDKLMQQARELTAEAPEALKALLATPLMARALERTGIHREELFPRTLKSCAVDETHPLRVKVPEETARRKLEQHEERRVRQLARLLEEHEVVKYMAKQEEAAASERSHLEEALESAVAAEEKRLALIARRAHRKQGVIDAQNARLTHRRVVLQKRAADVQEATEQRKLAKEELLKRKRFELEQLALSRKAKREADRAADDRARAERAEARIVALNERVALRMSGKLDEMQRKVAQRHERADKRQRVIDEHRVEREARRLVLGERLAAREAVIQAQVDGRRHRLEVRRLEMRDARLEKLASVERSRRRHAFKREQVRLKLQQKNEEYKNKKELERALEAVRRGAAAKELIRQHRRLEADATTERHYTPGPGQYHVPTTLKGGFGFGTFKPKSELEWIIHRANEVPAPGQRQAIEYELQKGGKFSEAKPKSDIEWRMLKAAEIPAPGQRQNIATQGTSGGKFNMGKSKSEVEWAIHRAKTVPGAGEYSVPSSFQAAPRRIDDLRKAFKTKVLKKSAFDTAAEQFAAGNKGLLSSLRKARFEKLGRRLSQDLEAQQNAAAAPAAAAAADAGGDAQAEAEASL